MTEIEKLDTIIAYLYKNRVSKGIAKALGIADSSLSDNEYHALYKLVSTCEFISIYKDWDAIGFREVILSLKDTAYVMIKDYGSYAAYCKHKKENSTAELDKLRKENRDIRKTVKMLKWVVGTLLTIIVILLAAIALSQ
jgi:hypothetical protein